jgi:hypothetical protein
MPSLLSIFCGILCLAFTCNPLWAQFKSPYRIANIPMLNQDGSAKIQSSHEPAKRASESSPSATGVMQCRPGPWGNLEYYYVYLEAPTFLVAQFPLPSLKSRWGFAPEQEPALLSILTEAGLTTKQAETLIHAPDKMSNETGIYLFPSPQLIMEISPEVRAKLYAILRKIPSNEFHADPVLILNDDPEQWFEDSDLRPEIIAMITKLCYKRGDLMAFSDLSLLMNLASGETEGRQILKAMTRTRSMIVKTSLQSHKEVEVCMKYWTTGLNLRRKDVVPMLHSVVNAQGVENLDILHIMPALPRKLLYTYPDPSMGAQGIFPDCHWTSLNFFNYNPEPALLDSRLATSKVLESFTKVEPPYRFGDVLFFLDSNRGDAFHSCVYIADDIVYTKNGGNLLSPWILSKLDNVKAAYFYEGNGRIQGYRNKKSPAMAEAEE